MARKKATFAGSLYRLNEFDRDLIDRLFGRVDLDAAVGGDDFDWGPPPLKAVTIPLARERWLVELISIDAAVTVGRSTKELFEARFGQLLSEQ